ncbi:MIP family channel protein [Serinibacter arcticus]|uniref:MIP family channel protein n=1 Tax=Serinibacter arcticus TaxID=1655435 RepID=A0A2U1ZZL0_9MICO|nr:MIP family channel protein [Serinibacter arcticus]
MARLGAEAFGTFTLVLIGVGIALFAAVNGVAGNGLAVPLGFGIAVLGAASAVGHISGGHFNPAVSLGGAIAGRISWADLAPYWLAQLVGGTAASAILFFTVPSGLPSILSPTGEGTTRSLFSGTSNGFAENSPVYGLFSRSQIDPAMAADASFPLLTALIVEVVATAVFVGVILGVTDKRSRISYAPAAIGLTLAVLIALAAPITNGSLNPARSTATAIFSEGWALQQLWVFWVAPLLGAAIAGLIYLLATPAPAAVQEWPEVEPTHEAEAAAAAAAAAESAEEEADVDAIDALLARQSAAATVPSETVVVEEVPATQSEAAAAEAAAAEAQAEVEGDEGDRGTTPRA